MLLEGWTYVYFSRFVMGPPRPGPAFFKYVEGSVSEGILASSRYALSELDAADNPYPQWILTGRHTTALPLALRPEQFETIGSRLDRIEWHCRSVEDYLDECGAGCIDRNNLSDILVHVATAVSRAARPDHPLGPAGGAARVLEHARPAPPAGDDGRPVTAFD